MAPIQGRVKFFDAVKGFGFIRNPSGGADYFVHVSQVDPDDVPLVPEQAVVFVPGKSQKGMAAFNVRRAIYD
ncbi:MAG: cold shock domain-containing protein [Rhodopseudomonas palustris]|uniref:Cold shock domain-containing protein n=1 Tax=Rhodopseudomonas palustris TaxID=1076 RepID=A0A933W0I5_RHOPL|nr:cold shock domain-containing protein [Rhodopseudomonas palustris]